MLYAEDTAMLSYFSKMMVVIVTVCAVFGLIVSEAKTETMCLGANGVPDVAATLSAETSGQVNKPRGEHQPRRRPVHRGPLAHT